MKFLRFTVFFISLFLPTMQPSASTEALQKDLFTAFKILPNAGAMGIADRREFAEASLAYWRNFDSRIPRNSPSDEAWLSEELNTTDMVRIERVVSTPQYALRTLASRSSDCVYLFERLLPVIAVSRELELYIWIKSVSCWREPEDVAIYLQFAGLSDGELDGTFKLQGFGIALETTYGRIADGAIAPEQAP